MIYAVIGSILPQWIISLGFAYRRYMRSADGAFFSYLMNLKVGNIREYPFLFIPTIMIYIEVGIAALFMTTLPQVVIITLIYIIESILGAFILRMIFRLGIDFRKDSLRTRLYLGYDGLITMFIFLALCWGYSLMSNGV